MHLFSVLYWDGSVKKGGSIYFSMFFHILFNFWGTIIGPLLNNLKETDLLGIIIFLFTIVYKTR